MSHSMRLLDDALSMNKRPASPPSKRTAGQRHVVGRLTAWRRRRYWNSAKQLHWLKTTIEADRRWMAHDPVTRELTDRYLKMLVDEWEKVSIEDVRAFRSRVGLKPNGGA